MNNHRQSAKSDIFRYGKWFDLRHYMRASFGQILNLESIIYISSGLNSITACINPIVQLNYIERTMSNTIGSMSPELHLDKNNSTNCSPSNCHQ